MLNLFQHPFVKYLVFMRLQGKLNEQYQIQKIVS